MNECYEWHNDANVQRILGEELKEYPNPSIHKEADQIAQLECVCGVQCVCVVCSVRNSAVCR